MAGDFSAYFEFGTNIEQVRQEIAQNLEQLVQTVDSVGSKLGKGGAGGPGAINASSFLRGFQTSLTEMTEGGLRAVQSITDQFKQAASRGETTVNGQSLTQALRTMNSQIGEYANSLVAGLTANVPKEVPLGDVTRIVDQGMVAFREAIAQAIKTEMASVNRIGREVGGLKGSPFGTNTAGLAGGLAQQTSVSPQFSEQQKLVERERVALTEYIDSINGLTELNAKQAAQLRQSGRGDGRFPSFGRKNADGSTSLADPRDGSEYSLPARGRTLTVQTAEQIEAAQRQAADASQRLAGSTQGAAGATTGAEQAAQALNQGLTEAAAQARRLAAGLRNGSVSRIGSNTFGDLSTGQVYRTSRTSAGVSEATAITDPLELANARNQLVQSFQRRAKNSTQAEVEEKTVYGEFLHGFFGAGGRKRTGGASPIDQQNPLAGFAETAGIVSKYELQGRAIASLSGDVSDAVKQYADLDEAIRQFNNVVGDSNGATAQYIATLQNLNAAAGVGTVESLQAATRGAAAFGAATDNLQQKQAKGAAFSGESAKYSVTTGQNFGESQDQLLAASTSFGLDTSAGSLDRVRNVLAHTKETMGADSAAVGQALSELGATGKAAGFSLEEFATILGTVQKSTGEAGGTLSANLGRILDQFSGGTGKAALSQVGVDVTGNVRNEILSLSKVFPTLNTAQQQFIENQLGGARALRDLLPLLASNADLQGKFAAAINDTSAGDRAYNANISSIAGQLRLLSNEMKQLLVNIASSGVLTPLLAIVKGFELLIGTVNHVFQEFNVIGGAFKAFGVDAKGAIATVLELVGVFKLLQAARARLAASALTGEGVGGGITGIVANRIGARRIGRGQDYATGQNLTPEAAASQQAAYKNGTLGQAAPGTRLAAAETRSSEQIIGAAEARVAAEQALIAVLDERLAAETGQTVAEETETVATDDATVAMQLFAEAMAASAAAAAERTVADEAAGAGAGAGGAASSGGAIGKLIGPAILAVIGSQVIKETLKGTQDQLRSEGALRDATGTVRTGTTADDARAQAAALTTQLNETNKSQGGIRGFLTKAVEGLVGDDAGQQAKATAKEEIERLNKLASTITDLQSKANSQGATGLAGLVSFKSLDALNTSISNLKNTGADGTDIFNALTIALRNSADAANNVSSNLLTGTQQKIVAAQTGVSSANDVDQIRDLIGKGANLGTVGNVVNSKENQKKLKELTKNSAGDVQKVITDTITSYLTENPNFDPKKDGKALRNTLSSALTTVPGFDGQDAVTKSLVNTLSNDAVGSLRNNYKNILNGGNSSTPVDYGAQIAAALATNQQATAEAQVLAQLGETSSIKGVVDGKTQNTLNALAAEKDKQKKALDQAAAAFNRNPNRGTESNLSRAQKAFDAANDASTKANSAAQKAAGFGKGSHNDLSDLPPDLQAAKIALERDKTLLAQAERVLKPDDPKLDAARAAVAQDRATEQQAELSYYQSLATIASNNLAVTDKVGQDQATLQGIADQLKVKQSAFAKKLLEAQQHQLQQQQSLDVVSALNANEDANVTPGDNQAAADQAVKDAKRSFDAVAKLEEGQSVHSEEYGNRLKALRAALYTDVTTHVQNEGLILLAAIDPRNTAAIEQQTIANLQKQLSVTTDPGQRAQLQTQINSTFVQALQNNQQTVAAARTSAIDPRDTVGRATADVQNAADALALTLPGTKEYYDALDALRQKQQALASDEVTQANAALEASAFPGDPLQAAANKVQEAKNNLSKDLFLSTQWLQDWTAFKQSIIDNANAIANANLVKAELSQDLTDPVQNAKNELKTAQNKLDIDKFFGAPQATINQDTVNVRQKASDAEQAAFEQRFGFLQTDYQLYRITLPQYIQKLKDLRASIKGNTIQAINDRNEIDKELLSIYQQGGGQFNIGDIKLPTLYEARRQAKLAGQVTQKDLQNAGQQAINDGTGFQNVFQPLSDALGSIQTRGAVLQLTALKEAINAVSAGPSGSASSTGTSVTNHISISGADFAKLVTYLGQVLGVNATSTRSTLSTRKV